MSWFVDAASNFHPYECDGRGSCVHCDRLTTAEHNPRNCLLCDPSLEPDPDAKYDWDRDTLALDTLEERA